MMTFEYQPKQGDIHTRRRAVSDIYYFLIHLCESAEKSEKSFEVKFSEIKESKSGAQTRAIHLLCARLIPYLQEANGASYDLDSAKDFVKVNAGYMGPATEAECLKQCMNMRLMKQSMGETMSKEEFFKLFATLKDTLQEPKSFADATKEEMTKLIEFVHHLADKMGWCEVRLEPREIEAVDKYYDNLNNKL